MAIQTQTFKKRVRRSGLSPQARLVALVIADLRYERSLHHNVPLSMTLDQLADECGAPRRNVVRWLKECVAAGWVVTQRVYRDGRQRPSSYWVTDPTDDVERARMHRVLCTTPKAECHQWHSEVEVQSATARARLSAISDPPYYVVSTSEDASPPQGGRVPSKEDEPANVTADPPSPAAPGGAPPDAEQQLFDQWQADQDTADVAALAYAYNRPAYGTLPMHHRCPVPTCRAPIGHRCHTPAGRPHPERLALTREEQPA